MNGLDFEWDPVKASINVAKHGVDFERAATVFLDPFAITIPDEEHIETETRWITLGKDTGNHYMLVIHTFEWLTNERGRVRMISVDGRQERKFAATRNRYETGIRLQQR